MLSFQISNIISLASKVENTPELQGFWEKQYKEIFSGGFFDLEKQTVDSIINKQGYKQTADLIPRGSISISKHLDNEDKLDIYQIQNTVDIAVRFLDSLIDVAEFENSDRLVSIGVNDIQAYQESFEENLSKSKVESFGQDFAKTVYRASELLAEEKGSCDNWSKYNQIIRDVSFESWINQEGEEIGDGKKIFKQFTKDNISKTGYEIIPRRNVELLFTPFLENWESIIHPKFKHLYSNTNIAKPAREKKETSQEAKKITQKNDQAPANQQINQISSKMNNNNFNARLYFIGFDNNGKILYEPNNDEYRFININFTGEENPSKFLESQLWNLYKINVDHMELVNIEYIENQKTILICYSGKIEKGKYKNLVFSNYDQEISMDKYNSKMLEKYMSRNKILDEFRDVMTNNPSVIKNLKNKKKNQQKTTQLENREIKPQISADSFEFSQFEIDTESFGRIKIKIGTIEGNIKSLEFLLNDEFKNRFATFYSSFIFITSILNYMFSMDEDLNRISDFLKENMKLGSSIGLVSKVVYYSLQSIKEIV